jgi:hypothetical protein
MHTSGQKRNSDLNLDGLCHRQSFYGLVPVARNDVTLFQLEFTTDFPLPLYRPCPQISFMQGAERDFSGGPSENDVTKEIVAVSIELKADGLFAQSIDSGRNMLMTVPIRVCPDLT